MSAQHKLSEPEFAQLVTTAIEAYESGKGDYHEHEHRAQARKLGYKEDEFGQLWLDAQKRVGKLRAKRLAETEPKQVEPAKPALTYRRITRSDHVVKSAAAEPTVAARKATVAKIVHDFVERKEPEARAKPKFREEQPWPEAPKPPENATEAERLTYPPGLLGHAVQYVYETDQLPSRPVALMSALSALGKGLDRKVIGPTGNSTVLFNLLLARTGAGKQHGHSGIRRLLTAMGLEDLIVAGGIASVQAVEEILQGRLETDEGRPSVIVPIDEYGSFLSRISTKNQSGNVSEIPSILQTLWGWPPDETWKASAKVGKTNLTPVHGPAFSIFGTSTDRAFFGAIKGKQVSEGFISRHQIFNAGRGTVRRVKLERARGACPSWLANALRGVAGLPALIDNRAQYFERKDGTKELIKGGLRQIGFGEGAEERWYDYDYEIRSIEDDDKIEVWIRAAEIALRNATIVAAYHTGEIDLSVLDWAIALVKHNMTQLEHDLKKYMSEDLGMADACDLLREQFVRRINSGKPRVMTIGDIRKFLERKIDPQKIMGVVYQLQTCGDIKELDETEGPGRPTKRYSWMKGTTK